MRVVQPGVESPTITGSPRILIAAEARRLEKRVMIQRPIEITAFEFVVIAAQRAAQLMRGCTPRVPRSPKREITAQREVASGMVRALPRKP